MYLNSIEVEPVQGIDGALAGGLCVVVGYEANLDASLVDSIEQCWENGEGLVFLVLYRAPHTTVAFLREVGALAPAIKTCVEKLLCEI